MWPTFAEKYPIISLEDGMAEEDWEGWKHADRALSATRSSWSATTCSSPTSTRLSKGIELGVANCHPDQG